MIQFYDSLAREFPEGAEYVALYWDDADAAPHEISAAPHQHWITRAGGPASVAVLMADYEPTLQIYETPGKLRTWAERRIATHRRAVVYSDRADLHRAHAELGPMLSAHPSLLWWIATLDDKEWTAEELCIDIAQNWQTSIPVPKIWANQFRTTGNRFDTSNLFGSW
jgi:hypothetical protein